MRESRLASQLAETQADSARSACCRKWVSRALSKPTASDS